MIPPSQAIVLRRETRLAVRRVRLSVIRSSAFMLIPLSVVTMRPTVQEFLKTRYTVRVCLEKAFEMLPGVHQSHRRYLAIRSDQGGMRQFGHRVGLSQRF